MTSPEERANLIEAAATAWRPRDVRGKINAHPAFHDLDERGRQEAFDLGSRLREWEAAFDPEGLSTTAQAVLGRIRRASSGPVEG